MNKLLALLVTAGFLTMVVFEVHHDLIAREPWPGHGLPMNVVVFLFVPIWLAAAISVWLRSSAAWVGIVVGALAAMVHGIGARVGGSPVGALFMLAAPALLVLSALARRAPASSRDRGRTPREVAPSGHR